MVCVSCKKADSLMIIGFFYNKPSNKLDGSPILLLLKSVLIQNS